MSEHAGGIVAAVVGLTVLSIVLTTNILGHDAAMVARDNVTSQSAVEFSRTPATDLSNLDVKNPDSRLAPEPVIAVFDTVSSPRTFEFIGQISRADPSATIRYEWAPAGTVTVDDSTVTYYDVRRFVNGRLAGYISGAVTNPSICLLDADGAAISVLHDKRRIEVGLRIVSNLGSGRIGEWVRLNKVFHPKALSHYDSVTS